MIIGVPNTGEFLVSFFLLMFEAVFLGATAEAYSCYKGERQWVLGLVTWSRRTLFVFPSVVAVLAQETAGCMSSEALRWV